MKFIISLILISICSISIAQLKNNQLSFSHTSGFYIRNFALKVSSENNDTIRFTTNGEIPTYHSTVFLDSVPITILSYIPDTLVNIKTSPRNFKGHTDKFKANILRFATFKNGIQTSPIYNQSYFVGNAKQEKYPNVPLISLITDANNFFNNDTGIYVPGIHHKQNSNSGNYAQKGEKWERVVHLQFFDTEGNFQFGQDMGARIHGRIRRIPQKSIRLCARKKYGKGTINYPFFDTRDNSSFKKLILRNSMGCWQKTLFKDQLTSFICQDLDFEVAASQPVIVFLNGEYWGIHVIREYFNDNYFSNKFLVPKDSVNLVKHDYGVSAASNPKRDIEEGSGAGLKDLYNHLANVDLRDSSNYITLQKWIDISSIIDYYCAEIFFNNKDWPSNNNVLWSIGRNGQWRQIFSDLDAGWLNPESNTLSFLLSSNSSATFLFRKLMTSSEFQIQFSKRMACLLTNEFNQRNIIDAIDKYEKRYEPIIQDHIYRWEIPGSIKQWKGKINVLRSFATNRSAYIIKDFKENFGSSFEIDLDNCYKL